MKTKYSWLFLSLIILFNCENDDTSSIEVLPSLTAGDADFSTYVAIGNSLTAGFTDNALFQAGQMNSYPNLLAQKFSMVGGGTFTQPLTDDNVGGLLIGGNPLPGFGPRLFFNGQGPAVLPAQPTTDITNNPSGPFNNLGVPGITIFQTPFNGLGNIMALPNANPYYVRMASNPNASVLEDAISQNPTFVSLWLGNNDVLGFATSGGDQTISAITPQQVFDASLQAIVSSLSNRQGVIANIPDVTTIPFFTTVPFAPLSPANPDFGPQIPTLNGIFQLLNQVYAALQMPERSIVFSQTEASAVVIQDEDLTDISATLASILSNSPQFSGFVQSLGLPVQAVPLVANLLGQTYGQTRQANAGDLLTLTSSTVIGTLDQDRIAFLTSSGLPQSLAGQFSAQGITLPLADRFVLIPSEQQEINAATTSFNASIAAAANDAGFAFVDANAILSGDLTSNNFTLTADLVTGGAFSLDGVHPTARGYALIANEFMRAIDNTYGSNFEASGNLYDIGDFPTNYSPALQ